MNNPLIVIVGSGPSALATAAAVVEKGHKPLVIDASVGGTNPNPMDFLVETSQLLRNNSKGSPGRKSWLGSDLPYRQHASSKLKFQNSEPVPSHSFGGFSRIWGASCSFYGEENELSSPFKLGSEERLLVSRLLGFRDASMKSTGLKPSKAAEDLMHRITSASFTEKYEVALSTLAIDVEPESKESCRYCNQCLTGCPYNSIWMSGDKLLKMQEKKEIELKSGYFLQEMDVEFGHVTRLVFKTATSSYEILNPEYCFLATGAISTAEILINSKILGEIEILDSSTAFSAMLGVRKNSGDIKVNHALSQLWVTNRKGGAHFQIYSPSPGLEAKLSSNFPFLVRFPKLTNWLAERVIPVISYLPSEQSGKLRVEEKNDRLVVSTHRTLLARIKHHIELFRFSFKLLQKGYVLPSFLSKIPNPGAGYHFGASLPMGKVTNELGQLPGISNLSIVDASVLPRIAAGSITPSVMANAARISRLVCERVLSV